MLDDLHRSAQGNALLDDAARSAAVSVLATAMDPRSPHAVRWAIASRLLDRIAASRGYVASLHVPRHLDAARVVESLAMQGPAHGFWVGRLDLRRMLETPGLLDAADAQMGLAPAVGKRWLWVLENTMALALASTRTWEPLLRALSHHADRAQYVFVGAQWQVEPILKAWRDHAQVPSVHYSCSAELP